MKISVLFFSIILISANAQPKPGTVEGTVLSSVGGTPVKKATVTLRGSAQNFAYAALTDATGHFLIENVEPGSYSASADSSGFMPVNARPSAFKPITVTEEQHVKDVAVKLTPLGSVAGHVLDADGDPIAGANVQALSYQYQQGRKRLQQSGFASTNDLGEYQMIDLQPGRYYLLATAQPRIIRLPPHTRLAMPETAYPETFYPNGSHITQAKGTQVDAGTHIGDVDFRLTEVPSHHIRGSVPGSSRNTFVTIGRIEDDSLAAFGFGRHSGQVQPDGTFDLRGLVNGSYTLSIRLQQTPAILARQLVTIADQDVDGITLQPSPSRTIAGSVTVEGTPPTSWQGMQIILSSLDGMSRASNAVIDSDGTFSLIEVAPVAYALIVNANIQGKYVKSIRFADRDIADGQLDLSHQGEGKLEIVLASDVGTLLGGVQTSSGEPAVGALVTLAPKQESRIDLFKVIPVDPNGNFSLKDVAPGEYTAFAWQDVDVSMAQSADFRKPFESKGVAVSISPSGQVSIQLKLISADDVEAEKSKLP
jgi:hypothetical protein